MTKPILWLGPLEEVDADFDPLLGRSAKAAAEPTPFSPPSTLPADRSVFDDPDTFAPTQPPAEPMPSEDAPASIAETSVVEEATPVETVAPAPVEDSLGPDEPSFADVEPVPSAAPVEDNAPIDYSHNNDPIPERLMPERFFPVTALEPVEAQPVSVASNKSFFTRLFTAKPVAAAAGAAAVTAAGVVAKGEELGDDIWSRISRDAVPEEVVDPGSANEAVTPDDGVVVADTQDLQVQMPSVETQESQEEAIAPPEEPAILEQPAEPDIVDQHENATNEPLPIIGADEVVLASQDPVNEAVLEVESNNGIDEVGELEVETPTEPVAVSSAITEPDIAPAPAPAEEPPALDAPPTEMSANGMATSDVPVEAPVDATQTAATHPFSRAFNADGFWSIKKTPTEEPVPSGIVSSIEDLDPPATDLSATDHSAPEPFVAEPEPIAEPAPIVAEALAPPPLRVGADDRPLGRNDDSFLPVDGKDQAPDQAKPSGAARGRRRKRKVKKNYVGAFFGTFLFGVAAFMTLVSSFAAFGYPFDLISSYRWYWVILGVVTAAIWGLSRGWKMVIASLAVIGLNLAVTVPASGNGPAGGKMAAAVIGWANVKNSPEALTRVIKDADAKGATLVMLAEAPQAVFQPPAGWTLIEAPIANDPTAIAVLSKGSWRAVTVPGEPTMAAPPARDITIIGVHPQDAQKGRRSTPIRDALINRAGTRAGSQEGPTVVLGDFNAAPWDRAMRQFREYGKVTRVRCGGWVAGTYSQAFGLIGVATDHAYVRDVKVTHCKLGGALPGGHHKPIWLYVAPQAPAAPEATPQ
jgi:hypothetical protein